MHLVTPTYSPTIVTLFDDLAYFPRVEDFVLDRLDIEDELEMVYELTYQALAEAVVEFGGLHGFREYDIIDY